MVDLLFIFDLLSYKNKLLYIAISTCYILPNSKSYDKLLPCYLFYLFTDDIIDDTPISWIAGNLVEPVILLSSLDLKVFIRADY